jgi:hypothetical protein
MTSQNQLKSDFFWISVISVFSLFLHFLTYDKLGFHRDEFLYLALGKHLAAGYWSNPPLIGYLSFLSQCIPGDPLFNTRLIPALAGAFLVFLTALIARELGGRLYAQIMAALTLSLSLLLLRGYSMLQPVPFDILFWSLILYWLLRYINSEKPRYIILIGIGFGLGILNKYMVVFLAAGLLPAIILAPCRKLWINKYTGLAVLIALLLFLPNLWWQYTHQFPVFYHMQELERTQLVNVRRVNILVDQILMFTFSSVVWIAGLIWLLLPGNGNKFRVFGFTYLFVLMIFLLLRGKSYYMAGFYPFLFAAGGVCWEKILSSVRLRIAFVALVIMLSLPLVPGGVPVMSADRLVRYFGSFPPEMGATLLRWEDGNSHPLPQDFADMLGWDELGDIVVKACDTLPYKERIMIYCENYGQAGAIDHYGEGHGLPEAASFSDSYLLWIPDSIAKQKDYFIYVNNELGDDIDSLFTHITPVGSITNPLAREFGTTVYICRNPRGDFRSFWANRVKEVKGEQGLGGK